MDKLIKIYLLTVYHINYLAHSFMNKDYLETKERHTFEEAVIYCKSRGQNLLEIKSKAEQDFIMKSIVRPNEAYIWLGATNVVGTKTFKWLSDGSDVATQYSNWWHSEPKQSPRKPNAIIMTYEGGVWFDISVSGSGYRLVVCERVMRPSLDAFV